MRQQEEDNFFGSSCILRNKTIIVLIVILLVNTISNYFKFIGNITIRPILVTDRSTISQNVEFEPLPVGMGLISTPPLDRIRRLFNVCGYEFQKMTPPGSIFVTSENCSNYGSFPCHQIPPEYMKVLEEKKNFHRYADVNRGVKRVTLLMEMLKIKEIDWMFVSTDDILLNVKRLSEVIKELRKLGDPRTTTIIKSHCIDEPNPWDQGGSGNVFSRKAAELLVAKGMEWVRNINDPDDVSLSRYWLPSVGVTTRDTSSGFFIGHDFNKDDVEVIVNRNWKGMRKCPPEPGSRSCFNEFYPLKNVIVWHMLWTMPIDKLLNATLSDVPDDVYVYTVRSTPYVCQKRN